MFIRQRMIAHKALLAYMADNNRPPMFRYLKERIYKVIMEAENNVNFSLALDEVCCNSFDGQTAEGFGDLVQLFDDPPDALAALLEKYLI